MGALRIDANDPTSDIGGAAVLQCKKTILRHGIELNLLRMI